MLCEKFGWTYQEFLEQPWWFSEIVKVMMRVETEKQKRDMQKIKLH